MSEKQKINILWYTKDLRTVDQESLFKISQEKIPFIALYIIDEDLLVKSQFGFRKLGIYRAKFLLETIDNLKKNLLDLNIPFLLRKGKPKDIFQEIAKQYYIEKIYCQNEYTQEEILLEKEISQVIPNAVWIKSYSQFLIEPAYLYKRIQKIPTLFTTFRKQIERKLQIRQTYEAIPQKKTTVALELTSDNITLQDLDFEDITTDPNTAFPFLGGENEALKRINYYFFESKHLSQYKETRNGLVGENYSSKLSPWLANGSLSPVTIYHEIKKYEDSIESNHSTYWLFFELLWRDFFKFNAIQHGNQIFAFQGIKNRKPQINHSQELITKWRDGQTSSDFVNANMLELKRTGWMSNRGRQNVASYFTKILKQDWRIGAAYFEEMLIDYDTHSNYGNWAYLTGVGNDNMDRTFNMDRQAEMYDPQQEFRKLWLRK